MARTIRSHVSRANPIAVAIAAAILATASLGVFGSPVRAAEPLTFEARVLLQGHARAGAWVAVEVHIANDGPAVNGELRISGGGNQGTTRVARLVEIPTQSSQNFVMFAQPAAFGRSLAVELVSGGARVATQEISFQVHEANQMTVGIIAERPQGIAGALRLSAAPGGGKFGGGGEPVIIALAPTDLPDRAEGWASLDRLIWQDVDTSALTSGQVEALKAWLVGGGRLVVVGGTSGAGALRGLPDEILPYRPTATIDAPAATLAGLVPGAPSDAGDVPALAGTLERGSALATVGDRTIAAESPYGGGTVTLIGFDLTASWLGESKSTEALWQRLLPPRSNAGLTITEDSQLVSAVGQLPSLALPPIDGLIILFGAYILLIGPVNYLILRRLDRREWAWITMPALIALFAVGAFGYGAILRGTDVLLNELAIVRGAPGTTVGEAQVYLGVFSPSRSSYDLEVRGGALLGPPLAGDFAGAGSPLDVLQGDPAQVRGLTVGFGSLRTIRAQTIATVPLVEADLALVDGVLTGSITNRSDQRLEKPAIVLGRGVAVLDDLEPGETRQVSLRSFGQGQGFSLADRILGQFFGGGSTIDDEARTALVRRSVLDQLTYDLQFGYTGVLNADGAVLLAWGVGEVLDVRIGGTSPRRTGTTLYYLPVRMAMSGSLAFGPDLMRSTVVSVDALDFYREPLFIQLWPGSATFAYRPIALEGRIQPTKVLLAMTGGGDPQGGVGDKPIEPLAEIPIVCPQPPADAPEGCVVPAFDGAPEVEVFDRVSGEWRRLPHISMSERRSLADPERYVDPATGTLLVRFIAEGQQHFGFGFHVQLEGTVS